MSHFMVAVFTEPNGKSVDELLTPYNEELEVPHYTSKEELIEKEPKRLNGIEILHMPYI